MANLELARLSAMSRADHTLLEVLTRTLDASLRESIASQLEELIEPGKPAAADDLLLDEINDWIRLLRQ